MTQPILLTVKCTRHGTEENGLEKVVGKVFNHFLHYIKSGMTFMLSDMAILSDRPQSDM